MTLPGPVGGRTAGAPPGSFAPGPIPAASGRGVPSGAPASGSLPGMGLSVSIALPIGPVDPTATVTLRALVVDTVPGTFSYAWWDSLGDTSASAVLTLIAPRSGSVTIGVEAWDTLGQSGRANATLGVGSSPSIAIASSTPATDVGLPIPISINVSGGVPPFRVDWQVLPGGAAGSIAMNAATIVQTSMVATVPGFAWLLATVTDGESMSTSVEAAIATVHARPSLLLTAVERNVDAGALAEVTGLVTAGTPPFAWTAVASLPAVNVTGSTGVVGASETVDWTGEFVATGNATVEVQVVDRVGQPIDANASLRIFPALAATVLVGTTAPSAGAPLNLSAYPTGGVPPYAYAFVLSDREQSSGTLPGPGPFSWIAHPAAPGYLLVVLSVSDAVYGTLREVVTITVGPASTAPGTPASPPPPATSTGTTGHDGPTAAGGGNGGGAVAALGGVGLAGLVGLLGFASYRKRRGGPARRAGPDPRAAAVVRRLLEESGGATPSTLRLLAEEEGIGPAEFDAALARWESEGRIRREPDPDGSGLLVWSPTEPAPPAPPTPSEAP